jgi:hypothetical protein
MIFEVIIILFKGIISFIKDYINEVKQQTKDCFIDFAYGFNITFFRPAKFVAIKTYRKTQQLKIKPETT